MRKSIFITDKATFATLQALQKPCTLTWWGRLWHRHKLTVSTIRLGGFVKYYFTKCENPSCNKVLAITKRIKA